MNKPNRKYHGDGEPHYEPLNKDAEKNRHERYRAAQPLIDAVNLALFLKRPLLLEGDPGCGKTCLAYAVAFELGYPLYTSYVRSTTKARDLLYNFDQLERLYDIEQNRGKDCALPGKEKYVELKDLGKAVELSQDKKFPSVVLIDEVDKADPDFPNDLLQVIEEWRFRIDETGKEYDAKKPSNPGEPNDHLPLVIITSNCEKPLPAPFLRRCLYFYIEFPDFETLEKIVQVHFKSKMTPLFTAAIRKFMWLRKDSKIKWKKHPSTSELIDWICVLQDEEIAGKVSPKTLDSCKPGDLPCREILVKNQFDLNELKKA